MLSQDALGDHGAATGWRWMAAASLVCALVSLPASALFSDPIWQGDVVRFMFAGVGLAFGIAALRRTRSLTGRRIAHLALLVCALAVAVAIVGVLMQATGYLDISPPG